jgi:Protein of unknown function (DUF2752)
MAPAPSDVLPRPRWSSRVGPVASGGVLATAAALVAVRDPATADSRIPGCLFHQVTGLWCPACGLTRGTHDLLTGHIAAALSSNMFTPFVLLSIVATWAGYTRRSFGLPPTHLAVTLGSLRDRTWRWSGPALLIGVLAYGVLRNLPIAPLRTLAP